MLTIRLLGPPALERDGVPLHSPRGQKAWALLGLVLLAERPLKRRHLAELLFAEANDPLGALRWSLTELRRSLGEPQSLRGDPVMAALSSGVEVDVRQILGESVEADPFLDSGGELLETIRVDSNPEFDTWLLVERHRISAVIEAKMRAAAVSLLASGRASAAVAYAAKAVARNPLEEGNHELLARSLAMAGDRSSALRQIALCEDLFRRELGIEISAALRESVTTHPNGPKIPPLGGLPAAASQLEAGRAAIAAGAVDAGIQCLRRAVAGAAACQDAHLQARSSIALGSALVHAVRGRDEEGTLILHEAVQLAARSDDPATAVTAYRELGFVEVQAGRRQTADTWLAKAQVLADTDEQLSAVLGVRGMNSSDNGDYRAAFEFLTESIERSRRCGDQRQQAWSLSILGRAHLLRDEHSQAAASLAGSMDLVQEQRWMAFLPWPQSLTAELHLKSGRIVDAADEFERSWTMSCQLNDPCWESMAARGLGLIRASRGENGAAIEWLTEAVSRSNRVPDRYQWVHAYALDTLISFVLDHDEPGLARPYVAVLASLAARCDMRELVVRSLVHGYRLGDHESLGAALSLGNHIDNPALTRLLDETQVVRP